MFMEGGWRGLLYVAGSSEPTHALPTLVSLSVSPVCSPPSPSSDAAHHPLHLLGDLVAPQVVVEGPVGPVAAVVGD